VRVGETGRHFGIEISGNAIKTERPPHLNRSRPNNSAFNCRIIRHIKLVCPGHGKKLPNTPNIVSEPYPPAIPKLLDQVRGVCRARYAESRSVMDHEPIDRAAIVGLPSGTPPVTSNRSGGNTIGRGRLLVAAPDSFRRGQSAVFTETQSVCRGQRLSFQIHGPRILPPLWLLLFTKFLETRIIPERIEHRIEPEECGSERHSCSKCPSVRYGE
jgi:hypothetical protein